MYSASECEEVVTWLAREIEKAPDALRRVRNSPALHEAMAWQLEERRADLNEWKAERRRARVRERKAARYVMPEGVLL